MSSEESGVSWYLLNDLKIAFKLQVDWLKAHPVLSGVTGFFSLNSIHFKGLYFQTMLILLGRYWNMSRFVKNTVIIRLIWIKYTLSKTIFCYPRLSAYIISCLPSWGASTSRWKGIWHDRAPKRWFVNALSRATLLSYVHCSSGTFE